MQVLSSSAIDNEAASTILAPSKFELLSRLRNDLLLGLPVVLHDSQGAAFVSLIETQDDDRLAALSALGEAELVLTKRRATAMGMEMNGSDGKILRFAVPEGAGADWLCEAAGHAADTTRDALPDLTRLDPVTEIHNAAIQLAKTTAMLPAFLMIRCNSALDDALDLRLSAMRAEDVLTCLARTTAPTCVSSAPLPMEVSAVGQVHVFKTEDMREEHYAVEIGTPDPSEPVTVRLHSACFTGDVLGSQKCDCGPQLRGAMQAMAETDGVLLYLNQEGRGIGLANKLRAYRLQEAGFDTVEANHWLGFEDDERDFRIGARMLHRLGIRRVRLMTNNPAKIAILTSQGIDVVERVPLHTGQTACNARYLATKAAKSGHLIP